MRRRDFLKHGLSTATGLAVGSGLWTPPWVQARDDETYVPLQAGWFDDEIARIDWIKSQSKPFLSQQNKDIRGTGKGKVTLLWKYLEEVTKTPLVPHLQEIGDCFFSGTLVTMADGGQKEIERIKVGEYVLSHLGQPQKVTRTIRKPFEGGLIRFKAKGTLEDIVCTRDHLIWVNDGQWKPAGHLSINDSVFFQNYRSAIQSKTWDLLDICPDAEVKDDKLRAKQSSKWVNRFVHLDRNLAYVIGAYLAEGGCSRAKGTEWKPGQWSKVDFNLGHTEVKFTDKIAILMQQIFGIECQVYSVPSKPTVKYVRCQSKAVAMFFKHLMPGNTYTKEVPNNILVASKDIQLECLLGWMEGDGSCHGRKQCKPHQRSGPDCSGTSVSRELIKGMFRLANTCEFNPIINSVKVQEDRAKAYTIRFGVADTAKLYPGISNRIYPQSEHNPYGLKRSLQYVSAISKVATTVYCIDVDNDHSFIANGYSVHNCVSHGFGLGVDILSAVQMLMDNKLERWVAKAATEIIYAGSRVEVGGGRLRMDGSRGAWAGEFVNKWGVLHRKRYLGGKYDYTEYSGRVARTLGQQGVPNPLEPLCRLHPVKTITLCKSWSECRDAIANGHPVVMCSSVGFKTRGGRDRDGFLSPGRRRWMHAMLIAGIDDQYKRPGGLLVNSWGSNWTYGPKRYGQPEGSFWADASVIDRGLRQGDSVAMSAYLGYPHFDLDYRFW